jgi:hypothetical protein
VRTIPTPGRVATLLALADYVESDDRALDGVPVAMVKPLGHVRAIVTGA